jgi:hypothetical protein
MTGRRRWLAVLLLAGLTAASRGAPPARPAALPEGRLDEAAVPVFEPLTPSAAPSGPTVIHTVDDPCAWEGEGHLGAGLFFTGDFLFLQPRRGALDFAVVAPTIAALPAGNIQSVGLDAHSGLRAGLGWQMPQDGWTIGVEYTYLHSNGSSAFAAPPGGALFSTTTRAGGIDDVTTAAATANLDYNVIDLEISRKVPLGDSTDLRLFGGGRLAQIDQKFDALYNGGSLGAANAHVSSPVNLQGAGVTAGGEYTWRVYRGLGLYARARGALVSSQIRNDLTETNNSDRTLIVALHENRYQVIPVLELGVGVALEWEHLFVKVGYELTDWFNLIDSPDMPDGVGIGRVGRRGGDLSLEGLALQLGVQF